MLMDNLAQSLCFLHFPTSLDCSHRHDPAVGCEVVLKTAAGTAPDPAADGTDVAVVEVVDNLTGEVILHVKGWAM